MQVRHVRLLVVGACYPTQLTTERLGKKTTCRTPCHSLIAIKDGEEEGKKKKKSKSKFSHRRVDEMP